MNLMRSLINYLNAQSSWTALVNDQLYTVEAPQNAGDPFVTVRMGDEEREYGLDGPAELYMAPVFFRIHAADYYVGHDIVAVLSTLLDGYRGAMGDVTIIHCYFVSRKDDDKDSVLGLYKVPVELSIWYV